MKIIILENKILHYRKPFFNGLAYHYDTTVLHSGDISVNSQEDSYKEYIVPLKKKNKFYLQSEVVPYIKKNDLDVVIGMFDLAWVDIVKAFFYCKKNNIPFVWWGIGFGKNKVINFIRKILVNYSNGVILYTKESKELFVQYGIIKEKIFVANNTFHVENRIKGYEFSKDSILFVGSLDKRKQNDILINAFSSIVDDIPKNINLIIIGEGIELENLRKLSSKLKLENRVKFIGKVTDTKILASYYKKAICSVSFGQAGLSVLQSLAYGVPFITKRTAISGGEISNIIDGYNGFLCEDDIESLKLSLTNIILDKEKTISMGKNAYDYYSENATMEKMIQGFIDAIDYARSINK